MPEAFGRPINGEISPTKPATPQAPDEDFIEALDAILALPEVEAIRWEQYTPYFNDGEPCEFGVYEANVKTNYEGWDVEGDYGDGFLSTWSLYELAPEGKEVYGAARRKYYVYNVRGKDTKELNDALVEFNGVVAGGQHYELLKRLFGDHAQVTATKDGFDVEYYSHD